MILTAVMIPIVKTETTVLRRRNPGDAETDRRLYAPYINRGGQLTSYVKL